MKIDHVLGESVAGATRKLNKEYKTKLKQVPNVLKGVRGKVEQAMASYKATDPDKYDKDLPDLVVDVTNKIVSYKDKDNNRKKFEGNPEDPKSLNAFLTTAIMDKYQETIYGRLLNREEEKNPEDIQIANKTKKGEEPLDVRPGQTVQYKNKKNEIRSAEVVQLLGNEYVQLTTKGAVFAIEPEKILGIVSEAILQSPRPEVRLFFRKHSDGKHYIFKVRKNRDESEPELLTKKEAKQQLDALQKAGWKVAVGEQDINEGGSMPGVGAIHKDEIAATLQPLERALGIDLQNNTLGSVGKKEFSGDIDVAINVSPEQLPEFVRKLEKLPQVLDIAKSSVIMTKVKIQDYDNSKQTDRNRTGFVQVDFMPGDPGWMKTYYHSPAEDESKYKGVFRNIMIATIAAVLDRKDSEEKIDDGRPIESERWMWSPADGLVRIRRTPVPNKAGTGYTKKNKNEIIQDPIKDATQIARALKLDSPDDLNSYESLKAAIEKKYTTDLAKKILDSFAENPQVKDIGVPDDLKQESKTINYLQRLSGI